MPLIPLTGRISWKNPPWVTISLILINTFVFFFIQTGDGIKTQRAYEFYFESGLAQMEVKAYVNYLGKLGKQVPDISGQEELSQKFLENYFRKMHADSDFQEKLRNEQIIRPTDPAYPLWREFRTDFENKRSSSVTYSYGFKPADPRPLTFFTYMFLHAGFGHLLGNMIFLWLVGCLLEMGCGRGVFAGLYLVSGVGALVPDLLLHSNSMVNTVGASGAISGVMGAFAVVFGMRKVRVFLNLGFYFNTIHVPAIFLLPFWVGNELIRWFWGGPSNVAYWAHVGGLLSGAGLGLAVLKLHKGVNPDVIHNQSVDETVSPLMDQALQRMQSLDFDGARQLVGQVLEKDPDNLQALQQRYLIEKQNPKGTGIHAAAKDLLLHLIQRSELHDRAAGVFKEYLSLTSPRLPAPLLISLCTVLANQGEPGRAEKIVALIMKKAPDLPGIPNALAHLANSYMMLGKKEKWVMCQKILRSRYPQTSEGKTAASLLKQNA